MTNTQKLLTMIPKLNAIEFTGLARLLKVKLYKDEKDDEGHFIPCDFNEVLDGVLSSFDKQDRQRKREILRIVKKATTKPIWRAGLRDEQELGLSLGKQGGAPSTGDE